MWPLLTFALEPRVVGGVETSTFGEVVLLTSAGAPACSAVRLSPLTLVTAGHCVGTFDAAVDALGAAPVASVEEYPSSWLSFDAAIVRLGRPSPGPVATPLHPCEAGALAVGAAGWVVGFGATDAGGVSGAGTRRVASVVIRDPACESRAAGCQERVSPGGELIAGGDGVDACVGDSGGGLFVATDAGLRLAGLVSRGVDGGGAACGDGGIYVRVDALWSWIDQFGADLRPPACGNQPPLVADLSVTVAPGARARLPLGASDPEGGAVSWSLRDATADAEIRGNILEFPAAVGTVRVPLRVTDDGSPAESTWVDAWVTAAPGCGCAGAARTPGAGIFGVALTLRWRRRR